MLDNILQSKKHNQQIKTVSQKMRKSLDDTIVNQISANWSKSFEFGAESLKQIETVAEKLIEQNMAEVKKVIADVDKTVKEKTKEVDKQQDLLKKQLKHEKNLLLDTVKLDRAFFENMFRTSLPNANLSDLTNHGIAYFNRLLYSKLTENIDKLAPTFFPRALTLSGFYQEAFEYEGLKELFSSYTNTNVYHAGSKNTEMDIIISSLDDIDEIFNKNIEITKTIELSEDNNQIEKELLLKVNWFGEQVKGWSLDSGALTYSIGYRQSLFNAFLSTGEGTEYNSIAAAAFLAKFKNILLSLGPSNVLFYAGSQRWWMNDFIAQFRQKNYLLTFNRSSDKSAMNAHVVLEQYLTAKGNLRKRYLTQ